MAAKKTHAELLKEADDLEERGMKRIRTGRADLAEADFLRRYVEEKERLASLPAGNRTGTIDGVVTVERVRHSQGRTGRRTPLQKALNDANFTLRSLAEQLRAEGFRVSHPLLSQAHAGTKRIQGDLAKRIEKLTGLEATRKNWPKGWV